MSFNGFDPTAVALLGALPEYDADRYAAVKGRLDVGLRAPGLALNEAVAKGVGLSTDKRASVSPLHNDLRFVGPDASRYRDYLLLTAWEGADRKTAPAMCIRIDATSIGFGAGIAFTPAVRQRWRDAVGGDGGAALATAIKAVEAKHMKHELDIEGAVTKGVPKPWPDDHPRAELLKRTGFQLRFREAMPKSVGDAGLVVWCAARVADLMPVHRWLVAHVAGV